MNRYYCRDFDSVCADSMKEAAFIFANRAAQRKYGKKGYCRTCEINSYSQNSQYGEYSAFIGYNADLNETTGHNINFTVSSD